jgi:hypothetical protein
VIIDTDGSGFHLTSAAEGIKWDFFGNGHAIQIAWTAKGSTNGWLAMPNSKGQITSARPLFSNLANQPTPPAAIGPNGLNALKLYDTNGDGVIDKNDYPYWSEMRVWIDSNHDGVAQPGELHTLDSIGIGSISLGYTLSPLTDKNGNQFRLKGSLNPDKTDKVDRVIYDVTLATAN